MCVSISLNIHDIHFNICYKRRPTTINTGTGTSETHTEHKIPKPDNTNNNILLPDLEPQSEGNEKEIARTMAKQIQGEIHRIATKAVESE